MEESDSAVTHFEEGIDDASVTRSEEELSLDTEPVDAGAVRIRKQVETRAVEREVDHATERAEVERVPAMEDDTGAVITLEDGSISIPVFEEQLVIEKRVVVKERVVIRKHTVTESRLVETTLRRERVDLDVDPSIAGRVREGPHGEGA